MARAEVKVTVTVELDQVAADLERLLGSASDVVSFIDTSRPGGQQVRDELVRHTKALDRAVAKAITPSDAATVDPEEAT